MTRKEILISEILQVCKVSNLTNADRLLKDRKRNVDMESTFLALAFMEEPELVKIASDLNIRIPKGGKL